MIYYANCPFCENEFSFDGAEDYVIQTIYCSGNKKVCVYDVPCPHCGLKVIVL